MRISKKKGVMPSRDWELIRGSIDKYPSQNGRGTGRAVMYGTLQGGAKTNGLSQCYALLDFDSTENVYKLTGYIDGFYGYDYGAGYSDSAFAMTSETKGIIVSGQPDSNLTTPLYATGLVVDAYPGVGMTLPYAPVLVGNDPTNYSSRIGAAQGGTFGMAVGYYDGAFNPAASSNAYVQYINTQLGGPHSVANVGPAVTGLATGLTSGACCKAGSTASNRVVYSANKDTTSRLVLASPSGIHANVTWTGYAGTYGSPVQIGDTAVLAHDKVDSVNYGRYTLFTTNSASSPTTLTQRNSLSAPAPSEVDPAHVDFAGFAHTLHCSNYWAKENVILALAYVKIDDPWLSLYWNEPGDSYVYFYSVYKITNSGTSISMERLTTDINGNPVPLFIHTPSKKIPNYNISIVGAPDSKAVLFVGYGDHLRQYTFQL